MRNGPRLRLGESLLPGVLAVVLFGVMALVVVNTSFTAMAGFPDGISITSELGYALFNLEELSSTEGAMGTTEPFLAAFLLIAIALDAALDASLVLAKREEHGEPVAALSSVDPDDRPAPDSSGFGRSEPTVTDGGADAASSSSDGGAADTETETTGGDDR